MLFAARMGTEWDADRAILAWEGSWSSRSGSCFKHSVSSVARSDGFRGTYVPSPP